MIDRGGAGGEQSFAEAAATAAEAIAAVPLPPRQYCFSGGGAEIYGGGGGKRRCCRCVGVIIANDRPGHEVFPMAAPHPTNGKRWGRAPFPVVMVSQESGQLLKTALAPPSPSPPQLGVGVGWGAARPGVEQHHFSPWATGGCEGLRLPLPLGGNNTGWGGGGGGGGVIMVSLGAAEHCPAPAVAPAAATRAFPCDISSRSRSSSSSSSSASSGSRSAASFDGEDGEPGVFAGSQFATMVAAEDIGFNGFGAIGSSPYFYPMDCSYPGNRGSRRGLGGEETPRWGREKMLYRAKTLPVRFEKSTW